MELERVFNRARQNARTKVFNKEDQIELAWLEKRITDIGFGPYSDVYLKQDVHEYATIVESKGKLRQWAKRKQTKRNKQERANAA